MTNDKTNRDQEKAAYQRKVAWLKRYQESLRAERSLLEEIEALRAEAARVTQALTGVPGGGDGQALPRAVERIMDAQQRLAEEAERGQRARAEIERAVCAIRRPVSRDVLRRRYIFGQRWERIAADYNCELRNIFRIHHSAVAKMDIEMQSPGVLQ